MFSLLGRARICRVGVPEAVSQRYKLIDVVTPGKLPGPFQPTFSKLVSQLGGLFYLDDTVS